MIYFGNKKGQVAILMLFVVTIVLVISTLFVFFSSDSASPKDLGFSDTLSYGYGKLDSVMSMSEAIAKKSITSNVPPDKLKKNFSDIANVTYSNLSADQVAFYGNFFAKVRNESAFNFTYIGEVNGTNKQKIRLYNLKVSGLFIQASFGKNYEMKNFDLCMLFDGNGNYLKELAEEGLYKSYCGR